MDEPQSRTEATDWEELYDALRRRHSIIGSDENGDDLLHSFFIDKMPQVSEVVSRLPTREKQIAYIRAAYRNYTYDLLKSKARYDRALRQFSAEPAMDAPTLAVPPIAPIVANLPRRMRAATRAFLGVAGRPASIREISKDLGISRHAARRAIVDGLLLTASELGESGSLDPDDLRIATRVIRGEKETQIAAEMETTVQRIRVAVDRTRKLVGRALT
jgi:DNA-directed RNA polymerase specialized sigma24 family protein